MCALQKCKSRRPQVTPPPLSKHQERRRETQNRDKITTLKEMMETTNKPVSFRQTIAFIQRARDRDTLAGGTRQTRFKNMEEKKNVEGDFDPRQAIASRSRRRAACISECATKVLYLAILLSRSRLTQQMPWQTIPTAAVA